MFRKKVNSQIIQCGTSPARATWTISLPRGLDLGPHLRRLLELEKQTDGSGRPAGRPPSIERTDPRPPPGGSPEAGWHRAAPPALAHALSHPPYTSLRGNSGPPRPPGPRPEDSRRPVSKRLRCPLGSPNTYSSLTEVISLPPALPSFITTPARFALDEHRTAVRIRAIANA